LYLEAKRVLDECEKCIPLYPGHPHYLFIYNLIKNKCYKTPVYFLITRNQINKSAWNLNALFAGDDFLTKIAWKKCIYAETTGGKNYRLFRNAIRDQIGSYRRFCFDEGDIEQCCAKCSTIVEADTCHIDHEIPFKTLVKGFIELEGFNVDDLEYFLKWQKYHLKKASLRLLCPRCNLTNA